MIKHLIPDVMFDQTVRIDASGVLGPDIGVCATARSG